jgi:hypothetical protein
MMDGLQTPRVRGSLQRTDPAKRFENEQNDDGNARHGWSNREDTRALKFTSRPAPRAASGEMNFMGQKSGGWTKFRLCIGVLILLCSASGAVDAPANVAGSWIFSVSGEAGKATQTIVIQQDGAKITGTFKGPRQSGTIAGTVDGNKISFHVKARRDLDYTGTVDGDTMKGTLSSGNKSGEFAASREK